MNIAHVLPQAAAPADTARPPEAAGDAGAFDRLLREHAGAQEAAAPADTQARADAPARADAAAPADGAPQGQAADAPATPPAADAGATEAAQEAGGENAVADAADVPADGAAAQSWAALAASAAADARLVATAPPSSALADQVRSLTEASRAWSTRGLAIPGQADARAARTAQGAAAHGTERAQGTASASHALLPADTDAPAGDARAQAEPGLAAWRDTGARAQAATLAARPGEPLQPTARQEDAGKAARTAGLRAGQVAGLAADTGTQPAADAAPAPLAGLRVAGAALGAAAPRTPAALRQDARDAAGAGPIERTGLRLAATSIEAQGAGTQAARDPLAAAPGAIGASTTQPDVAGLAAPIALPATARGEAAPLPIPSLSLHVPAPVDSPRFAPALGQQLILLGSGPGATVRHAEMRLDPPELGPLRVSLSLQGDQASAVFLAAHPATRQAIEAALPQLQQQLAEAGIQLGQGSVGDQQAFEEHARQARHGGGSATPNGEDAEGAPLAARERPTAPRGLVDTFA